MRDDEREVQLFFAGSGQDFRRVGYEGSEHFGRLRVPGGLFQDICKRPKTTQKGGP